jgi:Cu2+-exporting ATPase
MSQHCFHCGLPVADDTHFTISFQGQAHAACCAGCQAVAQTIIDAGLGDYYQHRTASGPQPQALPLDLLQQATLYDAPELQQSFVHQEAEEIREASLILEGITCAACIWLIEQQLLRQKGILSVDINYSSHRARVRWDNRQIPLSAVLQSIVRIGYRAYPYDRTQQENLLQKERKQAINRLWVAGLSMMQVMMYAVPIYVAQTNEIEPRFLWMLHWASFLLTLPVVLYSARPFYLGAWRDLRARRVGMDTPVVIGILTAFGASSWALLQHIAAGVYFDSVSMFVFLLLGGRYLESMARRKAGEALENLVKLIPAFAHTLPGWPRDNTSVDAMVSTLGAGMMIQVRPGETVPADGTVIDGRSDCNESLLTGESRPVDKESGSQVIAGSLNLSGPLVICVEQTGQSTRLASITRLLDQALAQKPHLAVLADRFASVFVALLLLTAAGSFIAWQFIDPDRALWIMVSVLVISCPCALSLATPTALTAASGVLARRGLLITHGHALETLPQVTDVVFDKTGTLTTGSMQLLQCSLHGALLSSPEQALAIAQALECGSEHPLAAALLNAPTDQRFNASNVRNIAGHGVEGEIDTRVWRLGRSRFVCANGAGHGLDPSVWQQPHSVIALGCNGALQALFTLGDSVRPEAADCLARLQQMGLRVHLLSGDGTGIVSRMAETLHCDSWRADASPQDKLDYVSALQERGGRVLMVGDGINDAPVLARAEVSVAMGTGTDVARASGDMVLIDNRLTLIPAALLMAQRTRRIIRQNLWWAAGYNLVALPLAITGHVTPWLASLGMALSSLLVVSNALRLIRKGL